MSVYKYIYIYIYIYIYVCVCIHICVYRVNPMFAHGRITIPNGDPVPPNGSPMTSLATTVPNGDSVPLTG